MCYKKHTALAIVSITKIKPYLLYWLFVSIILGFILGSFYGNENEDLFIALIVSMLLVVNPIILPKIWGFVLARIHEIAKVIK